MKKKGIVLGVLTAALAIGSISFAISINTNKKPEEASAEAYNDKTSVISGFFVRVTDVSTIKDGEELLLVGGDNDHTFQHHVGVSYHYWLTTEFGGVTNAFDNYVYCNNSKAELVTLEKDTTSENNNVFYLKLKHYVDNAFATAKEKSGYIVQEAYNNNGVTAYGDLFIRGKKNQPSKEAATWTLTYTDGHEYMNIKSNLNGRPMIWKQGSNYMWSSFVCSTNESLWGNVNLYRQVSSSSVTSVNIVHEPTKTNYYFGETTVLDDLVMDVTFGGNYTIRVSYNDHQDLFTALPVSFAPQAGRFTWCGIELTYPATVEHDTRDWRHYYRDNSKKYTDLRGTYLLGFEEHRQSKIYGEVRDTTSVLDLSKIGSDNTGAYSELYYSDNPFADGYAEPNAEYDGKFENIINNVVRIELVDNKYYIKFGDNKYLGFKGHGQLTAENSGAGTIDTENVNFDISVDNNNHIYMNDGSKILVYDTRTEWKSTDYPDIDLPDDYYSPDPDSPDSYSNQHERMVFVDNGYLKNYHIPVELYRLQMRENLPEYDALETFKGTFFSKTTAFDPTARTKDVTFYNWTEIERAYENLSLDCKGYLGSIEYNSHQANDGSYKALADRYDKIINTYDNRYVDFMGRGFAKTLVSDRRIDFDNSVIENCSLRRSDMLRYDAASTINLTPNAGYVNPESIVIYMGDYILNEGTHYTYNADTGVITINANVIADDLTFIISAQFVGHQVMYLPGDGYVRPGESSEAQTISGVADGDEITLISFAESGFTAPQWQHFKAWLIGEDEYQPGYTYTVTSDLTITAVYEYDNEAVEEIENVRTLAALSYDYEKDESGNFTFSNVSIRFSGFMSKEAWDALDELSAIEGYGVLFTDDYLNGIPLDQTNCVYDMYVSKNNKPHPNLASDALKAANGVEDLSEDYYAWNLKINLADAYFKTTLTAVAYIKTEDGYVFFNELSKSVKDLAQDMLAKSSETYDGSLNYLATL